MVEEQIDVSRPKFLACREYFECLRNSVEPLEHLAKQSVDFGNDRNVWMQTPFAQFQQRPGLLELVELNRWRGGLGVMFALDVFCCHLLLQADA